MYTQDMPQGQSLQDKQVTVDVPEDRLAEFYAFFGRFLAVGRPGGRRGGQAHGNPRRDPRHGGHRCGGHRDAEGAHTATQPAGPAADAEPEA